MSMVILLRHLSTQLDLSEDDVSCARARERGHTCQKHDSGVWISRANMKHNLVYSHTLHQEVRETLAGGIAYLV